MENNLLLSLNSEVWRGLLSLNSLIWFGLIVVGLFFLVRFIRRAVHELRTDQPTFNSSDYKLVIALAVVGLAASLLTRYLELSTAWNSVLFFVPAFASLVGGFIKPDRVWRWAMATISLQIVVGIVYFIQDPGPLGPVGFVMLGPIFLLYWAGAGIGKKLRFLTRKGS